jgi:PhoPQ-activated pathogenicity-related protein
LYKNKVTLKENKRLEFAPAVVVKGVVKNLSRFDFKECVVTASLYKITKNEYKNYLLKFKPIKKQSILLRDIPKDQSKEFKMIVDPFRYKKEYGISLEANCK